MKKGYIYIIKNYCDEKVYIGQTRRSIQERFRQHMQPSTIKKRGFSKFYKAIAKYGKENFYVELLEETTVDKLNEREIYYIEKFDSYKNGYNSTIGGDIMNQLIFIHKKHTLEELKFTNKKHTLGELKELLNKENIIGYQVVRLYNKQNSYRTEFFFKYPDKYLDLPVINCFVKEYIVTILVDGGNKNEV